MNIDGPAKHTDTLSPEDFIRVTRLSPEERFEYFLQSLKQSQCFWGLYGSNGWVMVDSDNELCLPIWSHKEFVVAWERDDFPECEPKQIAVAEFIELWAAGLEKNNTLLLIFPCGDEEEGIVMHANEWVTCMQEVLPAS